MLGRSGTGKSVTLKHIIGLMKPDAATCSSTGTRSARWRAPSCRACGARSASCFRTRRCSIRSRWARTSRFRCAGTPSCSDREIRERATREARRGRTRAGIRQDAGGAVRGHAQARRPGARDGARSGDLLVDEPSAGLDPITADEIDELLLELKKRGGTTLVVVTHNIPSAGGSATSSSCCTRGGSSPGAPPRSSSGASEPLVRAFMRRSIPDRGLMAKNRRPPSARSSSAASCCSPWACS